MTCTFVVRSTITIRTLTKLWRSYRYSTQVYPHIVHEYKSQAALEGYGWDITEKLPITTDAIIATVILVITATTAARVKHLVGYSDIIILIMIYYIVTILRLNDINNERNAQ